MNVTMMEAMLYVFGCVFHRYPLFFFFFLSYCIIAKVLKITKESWSFLITALVVNNLFPYFL
jgi:hypothetical protein